MAGEEGFEPPNAGTKTQCLTTWRLPNAGRVERYKNVSLLVTDVIIRNFDGFAKGLRVAAAACTLVTPSVTSLVMRLHGFGISNVFEQLQGKFVGCDGE